jgi:hypothetical protein
MNGMDMIRLHNVCFYHFVSVGTKSEERSKESYRQENECHYYFKYKWGGYAQHNPENNDKYVG